MRALYEADVAVVVGFSLSDFDAMAQMQFAEVARRRHGEGRPLHVKVIDPYPSDEADAQLRANQERLAARTIEIAEADGLRLAASLPPASFDVVFLDPPFGDDLLDKALALAAPLVSQDGFLYVEAGAALDVDANEALAGWKIVREGKAGAVHFHLLQRENEE